MQKQFAYLIVFWLIFVLLSFKALTSYRLLVIFSIPFVIEYFSGKIKATPYIFALYASLVSIHVMFYEDWGKITKKYINLSMIPAENLPQFISLSIVEIMIVLMEILWVYLSLKIIFQTTNLYNTNEVEKIQSSITS